MKTQRFAIVISAAIAIAGAADAQTLNFYKTNKSIQIHTKEKLGNNGKNRLKFFKSKATYYGAAYINISEDVGGTTWANHKLSTALKNAKKSCEGKSVNKSGCVLLATAIPRGYKEVKNATTLNQDASKHYFGKFSKHVKQYGWGSIATDGQWSWGWSSGETKEAANRSALDWCREASANAKAGADHFWVTKVAKSSDWTCKTVIVTSK